MIDLVQARLQEKTDLPSIQVAESLEVVAASVATAEDRTVFVVPFREKARPQRNATGFHRQTVDVQFVTVLILRLHDDPRGQARARAFEDLKGQMETALVGWPPKQGGDIVSFVASETQGLGNSVSILTQTWQTTRFLTGVMP